MAERLTARSAKNNMVYLVNVKNNEQEIAGSYNTLMCIKTSWERLAEYEDLGSVEELSRLKEIQQWYQEQFEEVGEKLCDLENKIADGKLVEVVRCKDCRNNYYENKSGKICKGACYHNLPAKGYCSQGERRCE